LVCKSIWRWAPKSDFVVVARKIFPFCQAKVWPGFVLFLLLPTARGDSMRHTVFREPFSFDLRPVSWQPACFMFEYHPPPRAVACFFLNLAAGLFSGSSPKKPLSSLYPKNIPRLPPKKPPNLRATLHRPPRMDEGGLARGTFPKWF